LENLAVPKSPQLRIAILGVGNVLNGDDGAGVAVVRRLTKRYGARQSSLSLPLLIEAGPAPENFTGALRQYQPGLVILVDAVEMGEQPGKISLLDWRDTAGFGPSTHLQPLSTLGEYLTSELGCLVALIGVQVARLDFDAPLSMAVEEAVEVLVDGLEDLSPEEFQSI
jgi:hydrogenase 3 maturation protease